MLGLTVAVHLNLETWELETTVTAGGITSTIEGTYTITDTTFSMSSPDPEFSLSDFVSLDVEVEVVEGPGEAEVVEVKITDPEGNVIENPETDVSDGTWIRDGNTLTLTLSNGQVLVFEKL